MPRRARDFLGLVMMATIACGSSADVPSEVQAELATAVATTS